MLRAVFRYTKVDGATGAEQSGLYTLDFEAPEFEEALMKFKTEEDGVAHVQQLLGIEVRSTAHLKRGTH